MSLKKKRFDYTVAAVATLIVILLHQSSFIMYLMWTFNSPEIYISLIFNPTKLNWFSSENLVLWNTATWQNSFSVLYHVRQVCASHLQQKCANLSTTFAELNTVICPIPLLFLSLIFSNFAALSLSISIFSGLWMLEV